MREMPKQYAIIYQTNCSRRKIHEKIIGSIRTLSPVIACL
jgi:hypothetical protein